MSKSKFALDGLKEMLTLKQADLASHEHSLTSHKRACEIKKKDIAMCRADIKSLEAAIAGLGSVDRKEPTMRDPVKKTK